MIDFLSPPIIAALVTAITSLIISLIALYQFFRTQSFQKQFLEKTQNRDFTSKLYELRLEHYPTAYEITDCIYREKGGTLNPEKIKVACNQLIDWKKGIISLILSVEARDSFFELRKTLLKNPANDDKYSDEQILNIINMTQYFRKQLRRDLGFLYKEEKQKRISD